jgi:DNA-binding GntR family transcriptional regulator
MLSKLIKVNLSEKVADILRDSIISGKLKPGERLNEKKISLEIGVSRLPIREALRLLQNESLVESIPNKGVFVATLSPNDIQDLFTIRAIIEGLAIKLAIANIKDDEISKLQAIYNQILVAASEDDEASLIRLDFEFHSMIAKFSGSRYLYRIFNYIKGLVLMYLMYDTEVLKENNRLVDSQQEHLIILDAIKKRDLNLAVQSLNNHIEQSGLSIMNYLLRVDKNSSSKTFPL